MVCRRLDQVGGGQNAACAGVSFCRFAPKRLACKGCCRLELAVVLFEQGCRRAITAVMSAMTALNEWKRLRLD